MRCQQYNITPQTVLQINTRATSSIKKRKNQLNRKRFSSFCFFSFLLAVHVVLSLISAIRQIELICLEKSVFYILYLSGKDPIENIFKGDVLS